MAKNNEFSNKLDQLARHLFDRKDNVVFNIVFLSAYVLLWVLYTILLQMIDPHVSGIAAQIFVLLSVYTVIRIRRYGYIVCSIVNFVSSLFLIHIVINVGNTAAWPGVVVPIITIVLLTIIEFFIWQLTRRIALISTQKEELLDLYNDISAQDKALAQKNVQLTESTEALRLNELRLHHLANFDLLTELPNRDRIISQLDLLTGIMVHRDMSFCLILLDLDNFKRTNETLGHQAGDLLLKNVALRLRDVLHPDDMLGRMGSDEFCVIVQRKIQDNDILNYVAVMRKTLLEPFSINTSEIPVTASFGIAVFPRDGTDRKELMTNADTALHKAKDLGRNSVQIFRPEMKEDALTYAKYERRLLTSIQNNELFLMYQPQFRTDTKELRGFETLVRWESPQFGVVSPGRFISIAENAGFIIPMGEWILRTACSRFKAVQDEFGVHPKLSVNISALQIMTPSFVETVRIVLEETGFLPGDLELEITESVFIHSLEYVSNVLNELRDMGIGIALDDFGTGYSSLSYLRKLPIETLKIDKSFIDSIDVQKDGKDFVSSLIALMHQLGMTVVAEGVDNEIQLAYLRENQCDYIQGYIWGKPMDEAAMREVTKAEMIR